MSNNSEDEYFEIAWMTPLGVMPATVGPSGLVRLHFPRPVELGALKGGANVVKRVLGVGAQTKGEAGSRDARRHPALKHADDTEQFLEDFFAKRTAPRELTLDYSPYSAFNRQVWAASRSIEFGDLTTYGALAARIGRPGAARAVGGALGRNPFVLIVPCHRVLAAGTGTKRKLGGFTSGLDLKSWLLNHENRIPSWI